MFETYFSYHLAQWIAATNYCMCSISLDQLTSFTASYCHLASKFSCVGILSLHNFFSLLSVIFHLPLQNLQFILINCFSCFSLMLFFLL